MKLDGKLVAAKVKTELRERVDAQVSHGARRPCLAIIQVGRNGASDKYVVHKRTDCDEIGIRCTTFWTPEDTKYIVDRLRDLITQLNADAGVDGIIVQLPIEGLNDKYYQQRILNTIAPGKDVDGLRSDVFGKLAVPYFNPEQSVPCTPHGILMLLDHYQIPLDDAGVTIVGRSNLVGRPLSMMLTNRNANVTLLHSRTHPDVIWQEMKQSNIIISAVGQPNIWDTVEMLEPRPDEHQVIIDVGTTPLAGKLVGDFNWDYYDHFGGIENFDYTPVPGGVGPMTRAALMQHTVEAYERHLREKGDFYDGERAASDGTEATQATNARPEEAGGCTRRAGKRSY